MCKSFLPLVHGPAIFYRKYSLNNSILRVMVECETHTNRMSNLRLPVRPTFGNPVILSYIFKIR